MDSLAEQLPHLFQLLGAYFHQDWCLDDPNTEAVLRRYLNNASPEQVRAVVNEITLLLDMNLTDEQLKKALLVDLACYYDPTLDSLSHVQWLR